MLSQLEFEAAVGKRRSRLRLILGTAAGAALLVLAMCWLRDDDSLLCALPAVLFLAPIAAIPAVWLATRNLQPQCHECGARLHENYNEVRASGVCSNCLQPVISDGAAVRAAAEAVRLEIEANPAGSKHTKITGEYFCRSCGYQLSGLQRADDCPECGAPVQDSLAAQLLRNADPAWRRTVSLGLTCLMFGSALGAAAFILAPAMGLGQFWRGNPVPRLAIPIAMMGPGLLMVATQDPRDRAREAPFNWRVLARYGWLCAIGSLALHLISESSTASVAVQESTQWAAVLLGVTAAFFATVGGLTVIRQLAERAPTMHLAVQARRAATGLRWLIPALFLILTARFLSWRVAPGAVTTLDICVALAAVATFIAFCRMCSVMDKARKLLGPHLRRERIRPS